jgi:ribose transport system substrate-binding protein
MSFTLPRRCHVLVLAVTAAALSACSSGQPGGGGDASAVPPAVRDNLASYGGEVDLGYPGARFDATGAEGKVVWRVTHSADNPFLGTLGGNFTEALERAGVTVTDCDGKGNPIDENNCITQAIAQDADAIQVDGAGTPDTYANALKAATEAGIPVLAGASTDASNPLDERLAGQSSQGFVLSGDLMADWIIADSGAAAHVLFITVPDVDGSVETEAAFSARMEDQCAGCEVSVVGVTLPNWASDLGSSVNAALLKDPEIDYVVPVFDPMTQFTNPAIQQAGKAATVKVVSGNGNLQPMIDLQKGAGVNFANVGTDMYALGYLEADLVLRALTGQATVSDAIAPTRVFDRDNIADLVLDGEAYRTGAWYTDPGATVDFFTELWSL